MPAFLKKTCTLCVAEPPYDTPPAALLEYLRHQGIKAHPQIICLGKGGIEVDLARIRRDIPGDLYLTVEFGDFSDPNAHVGVRLKAGTYHLRQQHRRWEIIDYTDLGMAPLRDSE